VIRLATSLAEIGVGGGGFWSLRGGGGGGGEARGGRGGGLAPGESAPDGIVTATGTAPVAAGPQRDDP